MARSCSLLAAVFVACALTAALTAQQVVPGGSRPAVASSTFDGLDQFVAAAMREWKVPGLAVAAIKDGQVVLSKGYGHRNVDEQLPVTPRALMAIGSNSKSFTVTLRR